MCRFDFDISKGRQSTRITSAGVVPLLMQIHSSVNVQACRLFGFECSSSGHAATCTCHGITLSERKGETTAHKRQISSAQFLVEKSGLWDSWGLSVSFICFCTFMVHTAFCSTQLMLICLVTVFTGNPGQNWAAVGQAKLLAATGPDGGGSNYQPRRSSLVECN